MNVNDQTVSLPWQGAGLTDIGRVRTSNQDAFAVDNELGLWVVADGMGGHAGGSIASDLAVKSVVDCVSASRQAWLHCENPQSLATNLLAQAVSAGDAAIRRMASDAPDLSGMGTTLVVALFCSGSQPHLAVAHIGDSRAYLIRDHTLQPLTTDHSFVQRLVAEGQISVEDARHHPQQNVLLKALGAVDDAAPDIRLYPLAPHDILLFCTDGLTKAASEAEILSTIAQRDISPSQTCRQLIDLANAHGGPDNITVVVVSAPTGVH